MRLATGSQRLVIICGPVAVKIPRLRRLRKGMRANRIEARIWREGWRHKYYSELCPVLASLPFGIALVMPAVRIMWPDELATFRESKAFPRHHPDPEFYEDRLGEWGYLHRRPVVVDYAKGVQLDRLYRSS